MKKSLVFLAQLLACNQAVADCSAPDLTLEQHAGPLLGFEVTKLWDEAAADNINSSNDAVVKFGDYSFLISARNTNRRPIKLLADTENTVGKLLSHFTESPQYLLPEKQFFTVSSVEVYDLTGDGKEDLLLFDVSPGANVYSGAIGIIDNTWKVLIKPTCY